MLQVHGRPEPEPSFLTPLSSLPLQIQQSKASFFQELRGEVAGASSMNEEVGKLMARASKASKAAEPGWSVLRDDFDGLQGELISLLPS